MKLAKNLTTEEIDQYIKGYKNYWKTPAGVKDKTTFDKIHKIISKNKFLTNKQLYEVAYWKTRRVSKIVKNNPDPIVRKITNFALNIQDEKFKVRLLCSLYGIGIPRASAILAMSEPTKYGVIDVNAWFALTGKEKLNFDDYDWAWYLSRIRRLAKKHRKTPREIDMALMKHGQKIMPSS
jgi:hypothetical protein